MNTYIRHLLIYLYRANIVLVIGTFVFRSGYVPENFFILC